MRIWHPDLIPRLCQKHLCAMWRESLGAYKIITENKRGYSNHPAVKEWQGNPDDLHDILALVRAEMLARGYNPKPLPAKVQPATIVGASIPWQSLNKQKAILRAKGCDCDVKKYDDKLKIKYTEQQDGRRKILNSQYPEICAKYAAIKSMRKVAALYGVDKRLIQFIIYPERLNRLKAHNIKIKHHLKYYKGGKERADAMKKYRQKKVLIIK